MSGADYILAINLTVAGLLAASFAMVAAYDKANVAARWITASYLLGMVYFGCEALISIAGDSRVSVPVAFGTLLAAMAAFNVGLARSYRGAAPWRLMSVLFALSIIVVYLIQDMPRQSIARMMLYQLPYALMQVIGIGTVLVSRMRRPLDLALAGLLAASSLQFLSKPFLALALGGWGASPQSYLDSGYAMISQSLGSVFGIAIALMMLAILVSDMLAAATQKSETDTLSGLLNRRGFEARAQMAVRDAMRQGIAMSMVICDIDHFKAVNDSLGHASGDRVIAAFSGFLRNAAAANRHAAGRIGGEEFAVILPGTNLVAARLFAEGTRSAFASLRVDGLPDDRRFTASFGVAELTPGESIADLLVRADSALYQAKNAGRDCVRVSQPRMAQVPRNRVG
jgi:diguanylate cyclase (GGDEF)-like protein